MSNMVRLEQENPEAEEQIEIEISLGNQCNYACSYCPPNLHDGSLGWLDKYAVMEFLDGIEEHYKNGLGKQVFIQYTGGEPSMYPGFEELLNYGHTKGFKHSIITNGSRTLRFWKKFAGHFDKANMTFHSEFADLEHFSQVVETLANQCRVHVNFTMIPEMFDEIRKKAEHLKGMDNVTLTLKALRIGFKSELYPYTDEQMDMMKNFRSDSKKTKTSYLRGAVRKVYEDRTEIDNPSNLILTKENRWFGWRCWAGIQQLTVDFNGNIHRGICRVGGAIGNIYNDYEFPTNPVICNKEVCSCVTDVMYRKENPAYDPN